MAIANLNLVAIKYILLFADPIAELGTFAVCFVYKHVTVLGFVLLELCKHWYPFFLHQNKCCPSPSDLGVGHGNNIILQIAAAAAAEFSFLILFSGLEITSLSSSSSASSWGMLLVLFPSDFGVGLNDNAILAQTVGIMETAAAAKSSSLKALRVSRYLFFRIRGIHVLFSSRICRVIKTMQSCSTTDSFVTTTITIITTS